MRTALAVVVLVALAVLAFLLPDKPPPPAEPLPSAPMVTDEAVPVMADAEAAIRHMHELVGGMLTAMKDPNRPPLGDNQDIATALRGGNKYGDVWLATNDPLFNAEGLLVDPWGTPYHFHPRAADAIDVRSAGPDRVLFTDDDLVVGGVR